MECEYSGNVKETNLEILKKMTSKLPTSPFTKQFKIKSSSKKINKNSVFNLKVPKPLFIVVKEGSVQVLGDNFNTLLHNDDGIYLESGNYMIIGVEPSEVLTGEVY